MLFKITLYYCSLAGVFATARLMLIFRFHFQKFLFIFHVFMEIRTWSMTCMT